MRPNIYLLPVSYSSKNSPVIIFIILLACLAQRVILYHLPLQKIDASGDNSIPGVHYYLGSIRQSPFGNSFGQFTNTQRRRQAKQVVKDVIAQLQNMHNRSASRNRPYSLRIYFSACRLKWPSTDRKLLNRPGNEETPKYRPTHYIPPPSLSPLL